MARGTIIRVLVVGVLVVAVSACSASSNSSAPMNPRGSAPTSSTSTDLRFGAPRAERPRDLRSKASRPCDLVSDGALAALGFAGVRGEMDDLVTGELACSWNNPRTRVGFDTGAYAGRDLLVETYRARLTEVFVPITVAGLPAVTQKTSPEAIVCTITVGVADRQALETTWYGSASDPTNDSCVKAQQVVEAIVGDLPPLR